MSGLNKVMLIGNLGADPEYLANGGGVLKFRLATNEVYYDKNNVKQERTEWHRVTMFGKRAESLSRILTKGEQLFCEGRIQTSTYEKNGEKRYSTEIIALNVVLTGKRSGAAYSKEADEVNTTGARNALPPVEEDLGIPF